MELLLPYCLAIFVASIIPGPSMLLAMAQGANKGWLGGAVAGLGNLAATIIQATVALTIIVQVGNVSDVLLNAIKIGGSLYILYIGISLLKVRSFAMEGSSGDKSSRVEGFLTSFVQGFMFAIANPKALLFFASLFPQFVTGTDLGFQTLLAIYLPICIIAYMCFGLYTVGGAAVMQAFGRSHHIGKVFGGLIIISGCALLLS